MTRAGPQRSLPLHDQRQDALQQDRLVAGQVLAAFHAGKDQQVLDEPVEPLRLGGDVRDELLTGCRLEAVATIEEDLAAAIDRRHRRPKLVRQHADEGVAQPFGLESLRDVGQDRDRIGGAAEIERAHGVVDREGRAVPAARLGELDALRRPGRRRVPS